VARYLLADNPVKYWRADGSLIDGFIANRGAWCIGQGYAAVCSQGVSNTAVLGWLQTDGTFCKLHGDGRNGYQNWHLRQVVDGPTPKSVVPDTTTIFDMELCYQVTTGLALSGDASYSLVMLGDNMADAVACRKFSSYYWKLARYIDEAWVAVSGTIADSRVVTGYPVVSYAGGSSFYVCFPSGQYAFADSDSGVVAFNDKWIDGFSTEPYVYTSYTSYALDLGVFVSVVVMTTTNASGYRNSRLRIYANEGAPTQLTDPIALQPITRLGLSTLQTMVLGAQDDPIEGCTVSWGLTGAGALLSTQSVTGLDGKAIVGYVGPNSAGTSELVAVGVGY
jgi:hypothetical protein